MEKILARIKNLSALSDNIKLYSTPDCKRTVLANMGNIPGVTDDIDKEYIEFLQQTNGAVILNYCMWGLKNSELDKNVYDVMMDLWSKDNLLTFKFWAIMTTAKGEYFGYVNKKNNEGNHFIGYYSAQYPEHVYLVASSFKKFMNKFLDQVEMTLDKDKNTLQLNIHEWFLNPENVSSDDPELAEYIIAQANSSAEYKLIY